MSGRYQPKPEAFEDYLKGRFYWNKRTAGGLQSSIEYYNAAIAADPQFALPYAGLADTYALLGSYNALPPRTSMPLAKKNAETALSLDERLAEALTSRAYVKFYYDWDWKGSEEDFTRAITLKPSYVNAHQWYGEFLIVRGRNEEALQQARAAVSADPLSLAANGSLGLQYYFSDRPDQAITQFQKTLELDKDFPPAILSLALALQQKGQTAEAIRVLNDALHRMGENPPFQALQGYLLAKSGQTAEARQVLQNLLERQQAKREYISAYEIAILYAGLGEREQMYNWLERAAEEKSVYFVYLKVDPLFKEYRSDPRFAALLNTLRLN
jgi:tetratricopeptide (TPR) repeat protein